MTFDIHQLDKTDSYSEQAEGVAEEYQDALIEQFLDSPEGQERAKADPEPGFWAYVFMNYGYSYIGVAVSQMTQHDARELLTDILPRKVSTSSPDDADDTIPELIAFWEFLKREYKLPKARAILDYLRKAEPEFKRAMNNPANFGTAKSLFMLAQSQGYDMTDEEQADEFIARYNAGIMSGETAPPPASFGGEPHQA